MNQNVCTLCGIQLGSSLISEEGVSFCCVGCHAVYKILSVREELGHFQESSLFREAVNSGLISNPLLLEEIRKKKVQVEEGELTKYHFLIDNLWCPACTEVIRLFLLRERGIVNCIIDYATDVGSVEFSPRHISKNQILEKIHQIGYQTSSFDDSSQKKVGKLLFLRFIVAAFLSLNIMMFSFPIYASFFFPDETGHSRLFVWASFLSSVPVLVFSAWPIFKRFWTSLCVGIIAMETLIVLGVSASLGLSLYNMMNGVDHVYFDSMSVIITFVLLGKMIETKGKSSAKESILRLSRSIPRRGRRKNLNGKEEFVTIKEIHPGDCLIALQGERIVLDGVVVEGRGNCDESLMTGESLPVQKEKGSTVLGGTILCYGKLVYRVTTNSDQTALSQILHLVEKDLGSKMVYSRAIDPFVRGFVPIILTIALGTLVGCWFNGVVLETGIIRAISVLLISCPCAVGIAAPLAESQLIQGFAKIGAIIRNRGCLPYLGRETTFVFDKTGTITEGFFQLLNGLECLSLYHRKVLKGIVIQSTHPIACALSRAICDDPYQIDIVEEIAGKGMKAKFNGNDYLLGSPLMMKLHGMKGLQEGKVHFVENDKSLTSFKLGDRIREDAHKVIQSLGSINTVLLSGDGKKEVESVATICGFHSWKGECSPLEKRDYVDALRSQGEIVTMMGDGINDAPALAGAHVSLSVVTATDISIQSSDIMLTTDQLKILPKMRFVAKLGQRILKQNLFWAFFYNILGIGLAVTGHLNPIYASAAMVLSSLIVLYNSRRIK